MLTLDPEPSIITFDCYGTLVQWHRALADAVGAILSGHAGGGEVDDGRVATVAELVRQEALARQQRSPHRTYKTVLRSALDAALAKAGTVGRTEDGDILLAGFRAIAPHPDAPDALRRLRDRYRLAIISNTDDDLIAGTVTGLGVPVDFVVTAEQAGAYKPDHQLFRHAHSVMGVAKEDTVHVAMGQFTDLKACHELDIRSVWINRSGEMPDPAWTPDAVLPDLSGLPELLRS